MKSAARLLMAACAWMLAAESVWAVDLITRRSSATRAQGEIGEITKTDVTLKPRTGDAEKIPVNDIVLIQWTGEPPGLVAARNDEAGGRYQRALDAYNKAVADSKSDAAGLKVDLTYFIARTTAKMAQSNPAQIDAGIKALEDFKSKNPNSYHFYPATQFLGDLYLTKKDYPKAKAAFEALAQAPFSDYKMASKIALARQSLAENNVAEAQAAFEAVVQMDAKTPAELSRKQEAKLGVAHCLQTQKDYVKAAALLDEVIQETAPDDARVQAEAYLRQGDCLEAAGKAPEALMAYLHVDVLFPTQSAYHAEALYHLSKLWISAKQQPDRAADAEDRLTSDYPNSEWAKKLKAPAN